MDISVVARHMEVTAAMREAATDKVAKLPRLYDGVQSAAVTFDKDAGENVVEIVAMGKRKAKFVAHHRGDDMYACLDQCLHKLEMQLRRHKDKIRDRQGPGHDETMTPPETP